jgi:hypothetical protein
MGPKPDDLARADYVTKADDVDIAFAEMRS